MVWRWLRNKLGIEDNTKELLNLSTKVYESIKLLRICISKLEEIEVSLTSIEASTPELKIEKYNENNYHERKKAFKIKGRYSARMAPFMLLTTDNKEYIKAFYSEDKGCTLERLISFINENISYKKD